MDVTIDRPVAGGRMLARHEGRVVLVRGAIPGERVRIRVERTSRDVTFATAIDVIEPSADRREPPSDPACGGADYAHIAYARQLQLKRDVVLDAFRRIAKITAPDDLGVRESPERGYRVRARLHIRERRAGFFREGTHSLCDASATGQLLPETMTAVEGALAALDARLAECEAFVVSENVDATERVIHVDARDGARLDDLAGRVALPAGLTGWSTGRPASIVALAGSPVVNDRAAQLFADAPPIDAGTTWTRHAASFFQGNRHLIGALVRRVLDAAAGERFVDLYAGVGLFAVALAAAGGRGLAIEGDRVSAADLEVNAAPFRDRLRAMRTSVEEASAFRLDPPPDVVVLDPPRTGVDARALAGMLRWSAPRVVYVSCDPPTLARDARRLVEGGYALTSVEAFDLFPNTAHVECVATFDRTR
jgi:tRNA/tmRNA/rRNA uracil-C5-methylase (TrmA/RlmC/RlmD family)